MNNTQNGIPGYNSVLADLTGKTAGDYTFILDNGYAKDSCMVTIHDVQAPLEIKSFAPDPVYDTLIVVLYSPVKEDINITITNSEGRAVSSTVYSAIAGDNNIRIDLSDLANGGYTITFDNNGGEHVSCSVTKAERPRPLEIISTTPDSTYDKVSVRFYSPADGNVLVVAANSSGQEVYTSGFSANTGEDNIAVIDLSGNDPGVYTISLDDDKTLVSTEVVLLEVPHEISITDITPNPTYGDVNITFSVNFDGSITAVVKNSSGEEVLSRGVSVHSGADNSFTVDLNDKPAGEYTIILSNGDISAEGKVIKQDPVRTLEILSCSPNPTYGSVTVIYSVNFDDNVVVSVTNSAGQDVYSSSSSAVKGDNNSLDVNLTGNPAGEYTIILSNGSVQDSYKVILQEQADPPSPMSILDYPETTTGDAVIKFVCPVDENVHITVADNNGNIKIDKQFSAKKGENSVKLDFNSFDEGKYTVKLNDNETTVSCMIKKEYEYSFEISGIDPNPTIDDNILLVLISPVAAPVHIDIFNEFNKKSSVDHYDVNVQKGRNRINLDLINVKEPGKYEIVIDNGKTKLRTEFVKQAHF
jgi:surface antigen